MTLASVLRDVRQPLTHVELDGLARLWLVLGGRA